MNMRTLVFGALALLLGACGGGGGGAGPEPVQPPAEPGWSPALATRLERPGWIAATPQGHFVLDDIRTVYELRPDGMARAVGGEVQPTVQGLAVSADNEIFAAISGLTNVTLQWQADRGAIRKLTGAGAPLDLVTGRWVLEGDPSGIAVDAQGGVHVAMASRNLVARFAPGSTTATTSATPYPVTALSRDPAGNLYLVEGQRQFPTTVAPRNVLSRMTPQGEVSLFAGRPFSTASVDGPPGVAAFGALRAVVFDPTDGSLLVADGHAIRRVAPDGSVATLAGHPATAGDADGPAASARFAWPKGLALDRQGDLYIVDSGNLLVRKLTRTGQVTTVMGVAPPR